MWISFFGWKNNDQTRSFNFLINTDCIFEGKCGDILIYKTYNSIIKMLLVQMLKKEEEEREPSSWDAVFSVWNWRTNSGLESVRANFGRCGGCNTYTWDYLGRGSLFGPRIEPNSCPPERSAAFPSRLLPPFTYPRPSMACLISVHEDLWASVITNSLKPKPHF